jgi:hypothetical protein
MRGPTAFRRTLPNSQMGARGVETDIRQPQAGDLGDPQAAAARQADQDQVEPGVRGSRGLPRQVGQHGGQFAAGEDLRGVDADRGAEVHVVLRGMVRAYPRTAFRHINHFVLERLTHHLQRRSQRPFRPPKGVSCYAQLLRLGLELL